MPEARIVVLDAARELAFSFEEMLRYHGGGSPGGVAHAFKVLERGLPLLDAGAGIERRRLRIATAFRGPGARDGFELVTRAITGDRFAIDASLERPELGRARERFVFRLGYEGRTAALVLREGFVSDEFIALTRQEVRGAADEARLTEMKASMAARVMAATAADVYDAE
jgi:hypothetical protein